MVACDKGRKDESAIKGLSSREGAVGSGRPGRASVSPGIDICYDLESPAVSITSRQRDVLTHLCAGLSSKEIAWIMGISLPAVKRCIQHLFGKFRVRNRTQLALAAERMKILQHPADRECIAE